MSVMFARNLNRVFRQLGKRNCSTPKSTTNTKEGINVNTGKNDDEILGMFVIAGVAVGIGTGSYMGSQVSWVDTIFGTMVGTAFGSLGGVMIGTMYVNIPIRVGIICLCPMAIGTIAGRVKVLYKDQRDRQTRTRRHE